MAIAIKMAMNRDPICWSLSGKGQEPFKKPGNTQEPSACNKY